MMQADNARFEDDSWDLTSSVGLTATMVAAVRAAASRTPWASPALINDQFAEPLVRAVGVDFFARIASGDLKPGDLDAEAAQAMRRFVDAMAIRTNYFDHFLLDAARAGIRQVVILASGLDSRAYRLPWPAGTTVFEVDLSQVIDFKTKTLAALGAQPTADLRTVTVDLRDDWPAALEEAGFDQSRRTAWIAEGLLRYLSAEAQDRLLDHVTAQSSSGSRFATECLPELNGLNEEELRQRMQRQSERWSHHGFDLDMTGLVYFDDRANVGNYLAHSGWHISSASTADLLAEHGLPPIDSGDAPFGEVKYLSGERRVPVES